MYFAIEVQRTSNAVTRSHHMVTVGCIANSLKFFPLLMLSSLLVLTLMGQHGTRTACRKGAFFYKSADLLKEIHKSKKGMSSKSYLWIRSVGEKWHCYCFHYLHCICMNGKAANKTKQFQSDLGENMRQLAVMAFCSHLAQIVQYRWFTTDS